MSCSISYAHRVCCLYLYDSAATKTIRVNYRDDTYTLTVSSSPSLSLVQQVKAALQDSIVVSKKRKSADDEAEITSMDQMILFAVGGEHSGTIITQFETLQDNAEYQFCHPHHLTPRSASKWDSLELKQLKITFSSARSIHEFLNDFPFNSDESQQAKKLKEELKEMDPTLLGEYEEKVQALRWPQNMEIESDVASNNHRTSNAAPISATPSTSTSSSPILPSYYSHPIFKAVYILKKYKHLECTVNMFVVQLLTYLNYFSDWLYVLSEFNLPLLYGDGTDKKVESDAKADFTIMDIISFFRMCIIEDKSVENEMCDSRGQMIAECIAAHQQNVKIKNEESPRNKRVTIQHNNGNVISSSSESASSPSPPSSFSAATPPLFAVRVNGSRFYFYLIPIGAPILTAMKAKREATEATIVKAFDNNEAGFDFTLKKDREKIIQMLDYICNIIKRMGEESKRRDSNTKKT